MASLINLFRRLPEFLSRETSGGRFIPQVDGLRFVAILAVFVYHVNGYLLAKAGDRLTPVLSRGTPPPLSPEIKNPFAPTLATDVLSRIFAEGYFGVQLFFVISGLIIATPFAAARLSTRADGRVASPPTLSKYLLRRVTRLEPPYILNLLVCYAVASVFATNAEGLTLPHLLASLGYMHYPIFGTGSTVNAVAWSLEIEIQFYLLAPLFTAVYLIRNPAVRRGLIAAAIVASGAWVQSREVHYPYSPTHGWTILTQLQWFLSGLLLADFTATGWRTPETSPARQRLWDVAGGLAWVLIWALLSQRLWINLALPWLIVVAYGSAFRGRLWPWVFSRWALYTIGGMCYTIYLYHMLVIVSAGRLTTRFLVTQYFAVNVLIQIVLLGILVLGASSVLFALFERPFMKRDWPRHLAARLGLAKAPPA